MTTLLAHVVGGRERVGAVAEAIGEQRDHALGAAGAAVWADEHRLATGAQNMLASTSLRTSPAATRTPAACEGGWTADRNTRAAGAQRPGFLVQGRGQSAFRQ